MPSIVMALAAHMQPITCVLRVLHALLCLSIWQLIIAAILVSSALLPAAGGESLTLSSVGITIPRESFVPVDSEGWALVCARCAWNVIDTAPSQSCAHAEAHAPAVLSSC